MQIILFFVMWDIFYRSKAGKREALFAGIFAAVNLSLRLCVYVPGWGRYAASAVIVLAYCYVKYDRRLEKAVFMLLLFYNFHGMSFLIASSLYQYMMDQLLGGLLMVPVENEIFCLFTQKKEMIWRITMVASAR